MSIFHLLPSASKTSTKGYSLPHQNSRRVQLVHYGKLAQTVYLLGIAWLARNQSHRITTVQYFFAFPRHTQFPSVAKHQGLQLDRGNQVQE